MTPGALLGIGTGNKLEASTNIRIRAKLPWHPKCVSRRIRTPFLACGMRFDDPKAWERSNQIS